MGFWPCWSPSGSVSFRSLVVSGSHAHVIRPSVWVAPLALHLLTPAEKLIFDGLVRWVARHGDKLRRFGVMNKNYQSLK